MNGLRCDHCGFDSIRWSESDLERTLAHTDDLVGHVLDGADDDLATEMRAMAESSALVGDQVASVHSLVHRLHDLAAFRRSAERFEPMLGRVESLQASGGGVPKATIPVAEIGPSGVSVDVQGNRKHHGRPWQAICLYSSERLTELRAEGHPIAAGSTGENLTIAGVDWSRMRGGLTVTIGEVVLVTSGPAAPCQKIGASFVDRRWNRIDHGEHPGWARWYASIRHGGTVHPGDDVTVTS